VTPDCVSFRSSKDFICSMESIYISFRINLEQNLSPALPSTEWVQIRRERSLQYLNSNIVMELTNRLESNYCLDYHE
jgi:hypothetical protein